MSRPWSGTLKGQPDHRRSQRFVDQHGRAWHGTIEIKTGHPTGVLSPSWAGGQTQLAPNGARIAYTVPTYLIPDQIYVAPHPTDHGVLVVQYGRWIDDLKEGWGDWKRRVRSLEIKFHGEKANPEHPSAQTLDLAGQAPQRLEIVMAMQAGNKWALGLSPRMPSWARDMIPTSDVVEMAFPDAEDEYLDVEDENLSQVFAAAAKETSGTESERIAALEAALAESEAARQKAVDAAAAAKERQVIVKPRGPKKAETGAVR